MLVVVVVAVVGACVVCSIALLACSVCALGPPVSLFSVSCVRLGLCESFFSLGLVAISPFG